MLDVYKRQVPAFYRPGFPGDLFAGHSGGDYRSVSEVRSLYISCLLYTSRVHRSYIVNINSVDSFIGNMLFIGNCRIPISKSHKNEVLERLNLIGEV